MASLVFPELGLGQWQLAQVSERRGGRRGLIPCFGWDDTGRVGIGTCTKDWFSLGAISDAKPCVYCGAEECVGWLPGEGGCWEVGRMGTRKGMCFLISDF